MLDKIRDLLSSIRFWQVTIAALSAYLADLSTNGFSEARLLMGVSIWLGAVAGIGTLDRAAERMGGN